MWSIEPRKYSSEDIFPTDVDSLGHMEMSVSGSRRGDRQSGRSRTTSDYGTIETRFEDQISDEQECLLESKEQSSPSLRTPKDYLLGRRIFIWIPVCLIVTRIWGTIRFAIEAVDISNASLGEDILQANEVLLFFQVSDRF